MRRALLVGLVILAVAALHRSAQLLPAVSASSPAVRKPAGALDYVELTDGTSIALFDNRLEVRGPAMGDAGQRRIYLDEIQSVVAKDAVLDVETEDGILTLGLGTRVAVVHLKSAIDDARRRIAAR